MKKTFVKFLVFLILLFSSILFLIPSSLFGQDKPSCELQFDNFTIGANAFNCNGLNWQLTLLKNGDQVFFENGQVVNNSEKSGLLYWGYTQTILKEGNYEAILKILDENGSQIASDSINFEVLKPEYRMEVYAGLPGENTVFKLFINNCNGMAWVLSIESREGKAGEVFDDFGEIDQDSWTGSIAVALKEGSYKANFDIKAIDGSMVSNVVEDFNIGTSRKNIFLSIKDYFNKEIETFRPSGKFVPFISTSIPTVLDLSFKLPVVRTNILLAILTMIPLAIASELFTRTISGTEESLALKIRKMRPVAFLERVKKKVEKPVVKKSSHLSIFFNFTRLLMVILFYGLSFSLLDRTWKPFNMSGLILFLYMTFAYGIVGILDDIIQWRALKKLNVAADLSVRPTNVLISIISISASRLFVIVPGIMFGTPEALRVDEVTIDKAKKQLLMKISAFTFCITGFGLWAMTFVTQYLQQSFIPETISKISGGFESFILLVCAVALENTFVQMLGFTDGFGQALKKKNRWIWIGALLITIFVFYHTLINPRGELVEAFKKGNVILFVSVVITFVVVTFGLWFYFKRKKEK